MASIQYGSESGARSRFKIKGLDKIISFNVAIGLEFGHALANLASQRILSEKLQFLRFSQVPAGLDCPYSRPILHCMYIGIHDFQVLQYFSFPEALTGSDYPEFQTHIVLHKF